MSYILKHKCDRCKIENITSYSTELPTGWHHVGYYDYCPSCTKNALELGIKALEIQDTKIKELENVK